MAKTNVTLNTNATTVIHHFNDIDFMYGYWAELTEVERLLINDKLTTMAAIQKDIAVTMKLGKDRFETNRHARLSSKSRK